MKRDEAVERSSGNVFADLGLPDADELSTRANYALALLREIRARGLTQKEAAAILGIDQPKVSAIMNGRLEGFSTDRLETLLKKLGGNVQVSIKMPVIGEMVWNIHSPREKEARAKKRKPASRTSRRPTGRRAKATATR